MSVAIDKYSYTGSLELIQFNKEQFSRPQINLREHVRTFQLNWLANITAPETNYEVSSISSKIKEAIITTIKKTFHITSTSLHLSNTKITTYLHASFNNICNGYSRGRCIAYFTDQGNNSYSISWKPAIRHQILRSALVEETLALIERTVWAYFMRELGEELNLIPPLIRPLTQGHKESPHNKSLYDSAYAKNQKIWD